MGAHLIGLVLAAGAGTRFGGPKALARDEDGTPWVARAVRMLRDAGCADVLVALGAAAADAAALVPPGARIVVVDDWGQGLSASLRAGLLTAASERAAGIVVTPVDTPDAPAAAVIRVLRRVGALSGSGEPAERSKGAEPPAGAESGEQGEQGEQGEPAETAETAEPAEQAEPTAPDEPTEPAGAVPAAAPPDRRGVSSARPQAGDHQHGAALRSALAQATYDGRPGHPVVIGAEHFERLAASLSGDRGARAYLRAHGAIEVECGDLWSGADIDAR